MENSAINRNTPAAVASKLAELTETIPFGDIWVCRDLPPRERSPITLSVLTALGKAQQLPRHTALDYQNGLSQAEIVELSAHLTFHAGWPVTANALTYLNEQGASCL